MIVFVIYAVVLAFLWIKTLTSSCASNDDHQISYFLEQKYLKIKRYKQYGLLYIVTLFYLVSVSMVSARYMPTEKQVFTSATSQLNNAWQVMLSFPWWLQLLFFIALVLFVGMFALPLANYLKDKKRNKS
ncbi:MULTISPECIES: hypothetical protein [Cysteiniphilum]|uniref:hypothetical protein n=1 Tax=Cysteiniphilum TaxID=2056696 RepID=UPI0017874BE8|nr:MULTISPECIES: hypothetical protein [Cysteiniphilum]